MHVCAHGVVEAAVASETAGDCDIFIQHMTTVSDSVNFLLEKMVRDSRQYNGHEKWTPAGCDHPGFIIDL